MPCTPFKLPGGGGGFLCSGRPAAPAPHNGNPPMPLATARHYAEKIFEWLNPHCERMQIVGSIRRERPMCGDVDIVCIPKTTTHKDLLDTVVAVDNHLHQFLQGYVMDRNPINSPARKPRFIAGGERPGKQVLLDLPKCQLDLWFADEDTWATRVICRTGSKEHNIWLAQRAQPRGFHWDPYNGLTNVDYAEPVEARTEEALYAALGLQLIAPKNREATWLNQHIDSGL